MSIPNCVNTNILLPQKNVHELWHKAVTIGQECAGVTLPKTIEGHLEMILIEHINDTALMDTPIAIHFLEGIEQNNFLRLERAACVSLLIFGLFPGRMKRMSVSPGYFISAGQTSYNHLALHFDTIHSPYATLMRQARDYFEIMARVLRGMRMRKLTSIHFDPTYS